MRMTITDKFKAKLSKNIVTFARGRAEMKTGLAKIGEWVRITVVVQHFTTCVCAAMNNIQKACVFLHEKTAENFL